MVCDIPNVAIRIDSSLWLQCEIPFNPKQKSQDFASAQDV